MDPPRGIDWYPPSEDMDLLNAVDTDHDYFRTNAHKGVETIEGRRWSTVTGRVRADGDVYRFYHYPLAGLPVDDGAGPSVDGPKAPRGHRANSLDLLEDSPIDHDSEATDTDDDSASTGSDMEDDQDALMMQKWQALRDLQVTIPNRLGYKKVSEWCHFETDFEHPRSIITMLKDPPSEDTRYSVAFSPEQSDKSIYLYVMMIACTLLDVPRIVVVCDTKFSTDDVAKKMNAIGAAINGALIAAQVPPELRVTLPAMRSMDGVAKDWIGVTRDDFLDRCIVVPGTYEPALNCAARAMTRCDVRAMTFVDEGDKLAKDYFDLKTSAARLTKIQKPIKCIFNNSLGVNYVTATPAPVIWNLQANDLRARAYIASLASLEAQGIETGKSLSQHPLSEGLVDKHFVKYSGWMNPEVLAAVREIHELSLAEEGLRVKNIYAQVRQPPPPRSL